jgi:hypothetical protein
MQRENIGEVGGFLLYGVVTTDRRVDLRRFFKPVASRFLWLFPLSTEDPRVFLYDMVERVSALVTHGFGDHVRSLL